MDTTVSVVVFPACGGVFGEDEDGTCVPYEDSQDSSWKCKTQPVRELIDKLY